MRSGWRRAFCTAVPSNGEAKEGGEPNPSPRGRFRFGFFSNPSTPRLRSQPASSPTLRCRTSAVDEDVQEKPKLQCKLTPTSKTPGASMGSNPSSPRSPGRFSLFTSPRFRHPRSCCGICSQSVKAGHRTAVFTAECSHGFHFSCIAAHVRKQGSLVCPVCNTRWSEVPLFGFQNNQQFGECAQQERIKCEIPKPSDSPAKPDADPRLYDDDEPLLSPRFIPIPEADEESSDEDVGEFQGFFANQSSSSSKLDKLSQKRVVETRLLPEAALLSVSRSHESYVVALRIKAPAMTPSEDYKGASSLRAPVDLVTVLDVSGSMVGPRLQMLKRAMRMVIASLGPHDRLSIVAFSGSAKRLQPLRRMTPASQRVTRRIIDRLACGNGTCVAEALKKAAKILEDRRDRNPVASIILLSDGQDEQVTQSRARQVSSGSSTTRFAHMEIPLRSGGVGGICGSHGQDAVAKYVGGLLSVVVQDLKVQIRFSPGEISGAYSSIDRPTLLTSEPGPISFGDLYAEEERELLLELRVPKVASGVHHVVSVGFSYRDSATQQLVRCPEQPILVPRPRAVRSSDPNIERLRNVFVTTRAVAEATRQAEQSNFSAAHHLLSSARSLLLRSTASSDDNVCRLEAELANLGSRSSHQASLHHHQLSRQRRPDHSSVDGNGEPTTPTSAWRAAEQLAKVAIMRKSMNRVGDLHGFENARF